MTTISETLKSLRFGRQTNFLNLTVFPLLGRGAVAPDYVTLRQAVLDGTATVREVSEGGSVSELLLENAGAKPVLVLDGEELIGAKQNRTANVTILAPAGDAVRIPVTCVEAGRWAYRRPDFEPSRVMHFYEGRRRKMQSVRDSMRRTGRKTADQTAVWDAIAMKSEEMGVHSSTAAMNDIYRSHRTRVEDYVTAFTVSDEQVGAVFAIGDSVGGLEFFDCTETLAEVLPKLVRSYAIDAIEAIGSHRSNPVVDDARAFLQRLTRADVETYPAVGDGEEVRLAAPGLIGAGLVADDRVVHLAAFATPVGTDRRGDGRHPFPRPRRRPTGC